MDAAQNLRRFESGGSRRYGAGARLYDMFSLERTIYGRGRQLAVAQLHLRPGDRVLDVGCGTGLSFALLSEAVGASGTVVGLDASQSMLARAERKVRRHGWTNVQLVHADASTCDLARVIHSDPGAMDAALCGYSLSVMQDGPAAWASVLRAIRPGGRVAVVDLSLPTGRWSLLRPLARLAAFAGGANPFREPWRLVHRDTEDTMQRSLRGGHVQVSAGTAPAQDRGAASGTMTDR